MERSVEQRESAHTSVASPAPSTPWVLGLTSDDEGSRIGSRTRPDSFWAECECPDDCPRDHDNE